MLCAAGTGTVAGALGYALWELARTPELVRLLLDDPDQIPAFGEEVIRVEAAVPEIPRSSTAPVEIAGFTIPAGSRVNLCVGAHNLIDDHEMSDGKIRRHRHWAFGAGPHRCLGSLLARMEMTVMIEEWLQRIPDFSLARGYTPQVKWTQDAHQLDTLPLRWGNMKTAARFAPDGPFPCGAGVRVTTDPLAGRDDPAALRSPRVTVSTA